MTPAMTEDEGKYRKDDDSQSCAWYQRCRWRTRTSHGIENRDTVEGRSRGPGEAGLSTENSTHRAAEHVDHPSRLRAVALSLPSKHSRQNEHHTKWECGRTQ